ncbi:MAG: M66 family metalloprotease [Candidatus Krumholzibacteriia bacterium]
MIRTVGWLAVVLVLMLAGCSSDELTVPSFAGRLTVEIRGLPDGVPAQVTLTGPGGDPIAVAATREFGLVPPGRYVVRSLTADHPFGDFYPGSVVQQVDLAGGDAVTVVVNYTGLAVRGGLVAATTGLPGTVAPSFPVTGPGGFQAVISPGDTLSSLVPGIYTVSAERLLEGETVYAPWPTDLPVPVAAGAYALATVVYDLAYDTDLDLTVARVEFTQATQRPDGTVPLIAGREAIMRVYGTATVANDVAPPVRVEWFLDGSPAGSEVLTLAAAATPTGIDPGNLAGSWNVRLPAGQVRPGLGVRLTIDPDREVPEAVEANNTFPTTGLVTPPVIERPALGMRLVPVLQSSNGLQGDATPATADDFVSAAELLMPVPDIDVDVHPVYTTSAPPLQADDGNNAWGQILSELTALRLAEDADGRHYYGAVKCSYTSGIAGLGRLSGYVAMGWDYDGSREEVLAHELGHNLGLYHVACGGPADPDPDYPYAGGLIGQWGLDLVTEQVKDPAEHRDLMSYCQPKWISDYMYEQVLASATAAPSLPAATTCLLVWGRRSAGRLILEPALVITARPSTPTAAGPYRIVARDAAGRELIAIGFAMPEVADLPGDDSAFAFTLPLPAAKRAELAELELAGPEGRAVTSRSQAAKAGRGPSAPSLRRAGDLRLDWNAADHPLLMVRRSADGMVLAVLRGGRGTVRTAPGALDLVLSDGVRSETVRVTAP